MQRVFHEYRNKSGIFTMIESLYAYISDTDFMFNEDEILWLDPVFEPLCRILEERLLLFRTPTIKSFKLENIYNIFPSKNMDAGVQKEVTVCLSGGKDSAAAAYYFKDKGYKVHLYHMTGINKAYGDEKKAAQRIADYLGCDLYIDKLHTDGSHNFIDHPLKNYIIANGAIHYAMANNFAPVLSFGNFYNSHLDNNEFEICGGDCIEMWEIYKQIMRRVIPEFDMLIPLATNADTFNILTKDWELLNMSVSCMSPYRFRGALKRNNENKFHTALLDNRCGSCWKCSVETMWLMDNDKIPYNEEFYLHCVGILAKTIYKETGECDLTVKEVWDNYMFYPWEKSKAFATLNVSEFDGWCTDKAMDLRRIKNGTI